MLNNIKKLIFEVSFRDKYSKHFSQFYDKYKNYVDDKSLYISFTMFKDNNIDKSFNISPETHNDPSGLYAYPLEYVINHPMDIRFGDKRKNLIVLKKQTDKVLDLQSVGKQELERAYEIIYGEKNFYIHNMLMKSNSPRWKPYLMYNNIIQYDIKKGHKLRTSKEQREVILKLGYKAIEDTAKTKEQSIINDNEPEQMIFLTRDSFQIVESFQHNPSLIWNTSAKILKKLFGIIKQKSKDKIDNFILQDDEGNQYSDIKNIDEDKNIEKLTIRFDNGNTIFVNYILGSLHDTEYRTMSTHDDEYMEISVYINKKSYTEEKKIITKPSDSVENIADNILGYLQ